MIQLYQKNNNMRVLTHFLQDPYTGFYLREVARELNMSPMTVKRALELLTQDGLLIKYSEKNLVLFKGDIDNPSFRYQKIALNISIVNEDPSIKVLKGSEGLISLILYGSVAKGTDAPDSDIDLLIISATGKKKWDRGLYIKGRELSISMMRPEKWANESRKNRAFYLEVLRYGIPLFGNVPVME